MPSSQLIQRSPRVRKQAAACRARWWIQPSWRSWVIIASIQGKPVCAWGRKKNQPSITVLHCTCVLHTAINSSSNSQQGAVLGPLKKSRLKHSSCGNASCYRFPFVEPLCILIPTDLKADGVPSHFGEVWCCWCYRIEELPPQKLPLEWHRGQGVMLGLQKTEVQSFSSYVPSCFHSFCEVHKIKINLTIQPALMQFTMKANEIKDLKQCFLH